MPETNSKKRFTVFFLCIVASIALYFISYYLTHAIVFSSFSKFSIRIFAIMKYFKYVIALDLIVLAVVYLHLMTVNRLKGNTESQKGFLYSFYYILLSAAGFSALWAFDLI